MNKLPRYKIVIRNNQYKELIDIYEYDNIVYSFRPVYDNNRDQMGEWIVLVITNHNVIYEDRRDSIERVYGSLIGESHQRDYIHRIFYVESLLSEEEYMEMFS